MAQGVCLLTLKRNILRLLHCNVVSKVPLVCASRTRNQHTHTSGITNKTQIQPKNILNLHKRGILHDIFPPASTSLPDEMTKSRQTFYCGFDPTAESLHVGNLLSLMVMLHCQRAGKTKFIMDVQKLSIVKVYSRIVLYCKLFSNLKPLQTS